MAQAFANPIPAPEFMEPDGTWNMTKYDERCRACSLIELCQPQALAARAAQAAARRHLFDPES